MNSDEFYSIVLRYVSRLVSDPILAQDITQDVFLNRSKLKTAVFNEKAWLYRAARNRVIDHFRKKTEKTVSNGGLDLLPDHATRFDPETSVEKKEQAEMLNEKINELSSKHREVLRLKFQENLKYAEIAEITGETVANVGWILHEAIAQLRKTVQWNFE